MKKLELHWQIMIAIVLAAISGWAVNQTVTAGVLDPSFLGISIISFFDYIGTLCVEYFIDKKNILYVRYKLETIVKDIANHFKKKVQPNAITPS